MTKFLALGLGLDEVVRATTEAPGKAIGAAGRLGTLAPGAAADVTMLRMEQGSFELTDARGESMKHGERLVPVRVVRNGVVRAASLQQARPPRAAVTRPAG
jgi:dihydroorotase